MKKDTSWGDVANWYDDMLNDSDDSYQKNVILPNLIRLVNPKENLTILDLACGQGYFSLAFAQQGAKVIGCDISKELISIAQKRSENINLKEKIKFNISPSDNIGYIENSSIDIITVVLALQNIENLYGTIAECGRVLKDSGKLFLVLNHPNYRIPQKSSWQWDEKENRQYRRIDAYMSEQTTRIDMTPGETDTTKKKYTVSFHRPLQQFFKALNKNGLVVSRLEEWISNKESQVGPRQKEEDRMRKEIPLFMCLECKKI